MINLADIQRIYRNEKASVELQKIDDCFYSDSFNLLSKLEGVDKSYVERMIQEIFERRRNKIVLAALRSTEREPQALTSQEKAFFLAVSNILNEYRQLIFSNGKNREAAAQINNKAGLTEKKKIRFLQPLPAIIGVDLVHYGPFKEKDVAEIPKQNAEILIEQEIAEEVE